MRDGGGIAEQARGIRSTGVEAEYQGKGRLADREEFGLVLKEMKGSQERPSV